MTLGGNVSIRNGNELDYCWRESIKSLLPVCDEVVVCDGESTDGTQEEIREWAKTEPKIKLCVYPWPNPVGVPDFWVDWLNFARTHVTSEMHIQLDADEVLSEQSYEIVGELKHRKHATFNFRRFNFWRDNRNLIPPGVCLSHNVCRMAPTRMWLPSDGPHSKGNEAVCNARDTGAEIFHYGFLRKRAAMFEKERILQKFFFNTSDPRLAEVENVEGNWMVEIKGVEWTNNLIPYNGHHPVVIHQWLKERGYEV